jgi:hypothetical protein
LGKLSFNEQFVVLQTPGSGPARKGIAISVIENGYPKNCYSAGDFNDKQWISFFYCKMFQI